MNADLARIKSNRKDKTMEPLTGFLQFVISCPRKSAQIRGWFFLPLLLLAASASAFAQHGGKAEPNRIEFKRDIGTHPRHGRCEKKRNPCWRRGRTEAVYQTDRRPSKSFGKTPPAHGPTKKNTLGLIHSDSTNYTFLLRDPLLSLASASH